MIEDKIEEDKIVKNEYMCHQEYFYHAPDPLWLVGNEYELRSTVTPVRF